MILATTSVQRDYWGKQRESPLATPFVFQQPRGLRFAPQPALFSWRLGAALISPPMYGNMET